VLAGAAITVAGGDPASGCSSSADRWAHRIPAGSMATRWGDPDVRRGLLSRRATSSLTTLEAIRPTAGWSAVRVAAPAARRDERGRRSVCWAARPTRWTARRGDDAERLVGLRCWHHRGSRAARVSSDRCALGHGRPGAGFRYRFVVGLAAGYGPPRGSATGFESLMWAPHRSVRASAAVRAKSHRAVKARTSTVGVSPPPLTMTSGLSMRQPGHGLPVEVAGKPEDVPATSVSQGLADASASRCE
jgi:hypothetical protein